MIIILRIYICTREDEQLHGSESGPGTAHSHGGIEEHLKAGLLAKVWAANWESAKGGTSQRSSGIKYPRFLLPPAGISCFENPTGTHRARTPC